MVDNVNVEFTGDTSGLDAAAQRTSQIIDNMRAKLQSQSSTLSGIAQQWASAFGVTGSQTNGIKFLDQIGTKSDQSRGKVEGLSKELQKLGTGAGLAILAKETADMADAWTRSRNLLSAVGIETSQLTNVQHELVDVAIQTRTALEPTIALYSRMYRAVTPLGFAQQDVARATQIVNEAMKAGGAAVSEQNAAIMQLSQSLGSGVLQGDELRSVRENAPLVAKAIADAFGTNISGLKKLGEQGALTSDLVFKAILAGGKAVDEQFATTMPTIGDSFNNLKTKLIEFIGTEGQATGASQTLAGFISLIANNLGLLVDAAIVAATVMSSIFVGKAIQSAITALISLRAEMAVSALMFQAISGGGIIAATGMTLATMAATALRAALAALGGPVGLILAVVGSLAALAIVMNDNKEKSRDLGAEFKETSKRLEDIQTKIDDVNDSRLDHLEGTVDSLGHHIETAAGKVERLQTALDNANMSAWTNELQKSKKAIQEAASQLEAFHKEWWELEAALNSGQDVGASSLTAYRVELAKLTQQLATAKAEHNAISGQGPEGRNDAAQDKLNQAVIHNYEVQQFAARANKEAVVAIEKEKVAKIGEMYGNESKQYIAAVKQLEATEKQEAHEATEAAKEKARLAKEAVKEKLAEKDAQLDAARDDKDISVQLMTEKLEIIRKFYGASSKEYQKGIEEQQKMLRRFTASDNEMMRAMYQRDLVVAEEASNEILDKFKTDLDQQGILVDQAEERKQINARSAVLLRGAIQQQELEAIAANENRIYELKREEKMKELALEGITKEARQKLLDDLVVMENQHNAKMQGIVRQEATASMKTSADAAKATAAAWRDVLQPIGSAIGGLFEDLASHTDSWENSVLKALKSVAQQFLQKGIEMAEQAIINEATKTSAVAAGAATRTGIQATEATAGAAISGTSALGSIIKYAWTAAAGAFSAVAGIPYIGPILAVAAGAAALAAVLGFAGNISSAEGGWDRVPSDGMITELHKDEMVLPARYANPLRGLLTGMGVPQGHSVVSETAGQNHEAQKVENTSVVQGDTHNHFSPVTNIRNETLDRQLRTESRNFYRWMANQKRNSK